MKDLIIIGGGAAGLTAGIYAARKNLDALLISSDFSGQIGTSAWIENYPGFKKISGLNLIKSFKEHLDEFALETKAFESIKQLEKISGGFRVTTDENFYEAKSLIIATGGIPLKLGVINEEKFLGKGVSYCVTCDGVGFKDEAVAVAGGGNAGLEAAIELGKICKKVYVLECLDKLAADKILLQEAEENKRIEIIVSAKIKSFSGDECLDKIIYIDQKSGESRELEVSACFIEIGSRANTDFAKGFLELNERGEIKVDPRTLETSVPGCFAAGDVTDMPGKQVVIACGQGASAVLSACRKKIF